MGEEEQSTPHGETRRGFLKKAALLVTGAGLAAAGIELGPKIPSIVELNSDWAEAQLLTPDQFIETHRGQLRNIRLGTTFSPEELNYQYNKYQTPTKERLTPIQIADILQNELGLNEVRIGLRGDRVIDGNGDITLKGYEPYIQALLKAKFKMNWGLSNFKVPRDPEHHFSGFITKGIDLPPKGTVIDSGSRLATRIIYYNEKILTALQSEYNIRERLKLGDTIQGPNEPFTTAGVPGYTASDRFLLENIMQILQHFPEAHIVVNSAGVPDAYNQPDKTSLEHVAGFISQAIAQDPSLRDQFIAGFDWYGKSPNGAQAPFASRQLDMNTVILQKNPDAIASQIRQSREKGYRISGTEVQWEDWLADSHDTNDYPNAPGESFQEFVFALRRSMRVVDPSVISQLNLWGIEHYLRRYHHLTPAQKDMTKIILTVNQGV